jgi:hypothetical protein
VKVCLLVPALPSLDPSDPIARHAEGLARAGHDVVLGITDQRPSGTAQVAGVEAIAVEDVLPRAFDVAMACSWQATVRLFEVRAARHAFWVDGFGFERLGSWQTERIAALLAYDLPVDFVCAAPWVQRALAERRPEARRLLARTGLDHARFESADRGSGEGALRVLIDERGAGAAAAEQATAPIEVTILDRARRAEQCRDADVLVMLDPVDGVLTTPLEAARGGVVPMVLPAGGQEDLVEHLVSGIVATPEDPRGAGRWLDRLAADRELLARLRAGARERASAWPSWDDANDELEGALTTLLEEEPPAQLRWPVRLMADAMAGVAVYRNDHYVLAGELERLQADEAYQAATMLRARWQGSARLGPVRRAAAPIVRAARRRLDR